MASTRPILKPLGHGVRRVQNAVDLERTDFTVVLDLLDHADVTQYVDHTRDRLRVTRHVPDAIIVREKRRRPENGHTMELKKTTIVHQPHRAL